jgi:MoaA/NifB/PqqE/SkfB family radical SAM enzyme
MIKSTVNQYIKNIGELKFAVVHVTTKCNAKCIDRCNIWASKPVDMKLEDVYFTIDVLARNHFSVAYFTGGETGLYPHIVETVKYAKSKGLFTSITTNGTIGKEKLMQMSKSLDALSVSVDHYDDSIWDEAKHYPGISKKAKETFEIAKAYKMKLYAVTFLNPSWTPDEVEKVVHYVNDELGVPFALSYPFVSTNDSTYVVGGKLCDSQDYVSTLKNMVSKVLQMKLNGSEIATTSCYLRDVIRAHEGLPLKYPCKAGKTILAIDCNLNVFPCYKKKKIFNLRDCQDLNLEPTDTSLCDNKYCMINCFKEASEAARENGLRAYREELFSNPKFYLKLLS